MSTKVEWTDITDNPIVVEGGGWWCHWASPGCDHCYAAQINQNSFFGGNKLPYTGDPPVLKLKEDIIDGWAKMRLPKKHFLASMTDIFGRWVPREWQFRLLDGMLAAPKQTFQLLTKRAKVMFTAIAEWLELRGLRSLPSNIWVGTSVENQEMADNRIPWLTKIPAAVRFLSCEPLLGPINLAPKTLKALQWIIIGGESGKGSRDCDALWVLRLAQQAVAAEVAVFVKQLGSAPILSTDEGETRRLYLHHSKGGDLSEWPRALHLRQFPKIETAIAGGEAC